MNLQLRIGSREGTCFCYNQIPGEDFSVLYTGSPRKYYTFIISKEDKVYYAIFNSIDGAGQSTGIRDDPQPGNYLLQSFLQKNWINVPEVGCLEETTNFLKSRGAVCISRQKIEFEQQKRET